ncbi:MAG: CopG family transcriptional regulator [bacterium]|nr:CopG family transcriptional regulator [bacterium]
MSVPSKQPLICLEPALLQALCEKADQTDRSVSDIVNDAVRAALLEDREDLAAFEERSNESEITYEELIESLGESTNR